MRWYILMHNEAAPPNLPGGVRPLWLRLLRYENILYVKSSIDDINYDNDFGGKFEVEFNSNLQHIYIIPGGHLG